MPVPIPQRKGDPLVFATDESPREDTSLEALAQAEARVQGEADGDGGQRAGRERRRGGPRRDLRGEGEAPSVARRWRASWPRPPAGLEPKLVMMTPVPAVRKIWEKTGWGAQGRRPRGAQRGLRRAGRGRDAGAGPRPRARERPRGRGRPRPRDRGQRRAHPDHAALRPPGPGREARGGHALPRRRQRCRHGGRAAWRGDELEAQEVAVLGAGTMGNGIAQVFAQNGHPVVLRDLDQPILDRALGQIDKQPRQARREGEDHGRGPRRHPEAASRPRPISARPRRPTSWSRPWSRTSASRPRSSASWTA